MYAYIIVQFKSLSPSRSPTSLIILFLASVIPQPWLQLNLPIGNLSHSIFFIFILLKFTIYSISSSPLLKTESYLFLVCFITFKCLYIISFVFYLLIIFLTQVICPSTIFSNWRAIYSFPIFHAQYPFPNSKYTVSDPSPNFYNWDS